MERLLTNCYYYGNRSSNIIRKRRRLLQKSDNYILLTRAPARKFLQSFLKSQKCKLRNVLYKSTGYLANLLNCLQNIKELGKNRRKKNSVSKCFRHLLCRRGERKENSTKCYRSYPFSKLRFSSSKSAKDIRR